ncbi:MAG: hypothetical protein FWD60_09190 [Candidatus Azobacteroides sp.]|nr:hypothetical protein [Candidatus Azobacteroides sp.]
MKRTFLFVLILSAMVTACSDGATKKLMKALNSSYDYDGKEVTLTGYAIYKSGALIMNGKTDVALSNSNWQQDSFADVKMNFGKEPNSIWMPDKFRLEDVEIYDSNGQKHGINTKLNLKGIVHYTHKDWENATEVKEESSSKGKLQIYGTKSPDQRAEEAKKAAEERKAKTGDPNDYTFELIVNEVSVAE